MCLDLDSLLLPDPCVCRISAGKRLRRMVMLYLSESSGTSVSLLGMRHGMVIDVYSKAFGSVGNWVFSVVTYKGSIANTSAWLRVIVTPRQMYFR